jgi:Cof subfamily protein (haloacid dehalogenase superfamily)
VTARVVGIGRSGRPAPRLVATDLDGTIVRPDQTISDRTSAAIARAERAGAEFVVVTGRPPRWLRHVTDSLGHEGLAICANGALVYDLAAEHVLRAYPIDAGTISSLTQVLRAELPRARFAVEYADGMAYEPGYDLEWELGQSGVREVPFEELGALPAAKLLMRDTADPDELVATAAMLADGIAEVTHSSSVGMVEISAPGVTKATTLAAICAERGIDASDVVAFGDMPNDLAMLQWAGRSYAVANAHPTVLAAVRDHIPRVDEDGVARVLEALFPG